MCSINHELKLIFIHTPKCGGLFVQQILEKFYQFETYYFTHENHELFVDTENTNNDSNETERTKGFLRITKQGVLRYFMSSKNHNEKTSMTLEKWNSYTKFAIKRNPYDRFISACKYINKQKNIENNSLINYIDIKNKSISNYDYFHLYITQYENLLDINNEFKIDFIINFENLNTELCHLLLKLGIPKIKHREILLNNIKINKTINENFIKYYNKELIDFVNERFSQDFHNLGYSKVNNMDELITYSTKYFITTEQFEKNNIKLLIELDNTDKIISFNESDYSNLVFKAKNMIKNSEVSNNDIIATDNEIILTNGLKLNTRQNKKSEKPNIEISNFHLKNIFKALRKMESGNFTQI